MLMDRQHRSSLRSTFIAVLATFAIWASWPLPMASAATSGLPVRVADDVGSDVSVGRSRNGNFVVVWATGRQLLGRRYSGNASPLDDGFVIDQAPSTSSRRSPDVAMDADGNFVVAWIVNEFDSASFRTTSARLMARRYAADGVPTGAAFVVDTAEDRQGLRGSSLAMNRSGRFVIGWIQTEFVERPGRATANRMELRVQAYASDGSSVGSRQTVVRTSDQAFDSDVARAASGRYLPGADVAIDGSGNVIVAWTEYSDTNLAVIRPLTCGPPSGCSYGDIATPAIGGVFTRRYRADGSAAVARERVASVIRADVLTAPSIAANDDGSHVVGWSSSLVGRDLQVQARAYRASGIPAGDAVTVAQVAELPPTDAPAVAEGIGSEGGFAIAWLQSGLQYRRLSRDGGLLGDQTALGRVVFANLPARNFAIASDQRGSAVVVRRDRDFDQTPLFAQLVEAP